MGKAIENEIQLLLDFPVYKDFKYHLFLGILKTRKTNLSYRNIFQKLRILFTQESIKSIELLGNYIRKAIEKREKLLKKQKQPKTPPKVSK